MNDHNNTPPDFFVPGVSSSEQLESFKNKLLEQHGFEIPTQPIYSVSFFVDEGEFTATVGDPVDEHFGGGQVLAIALHPAVLIPVYGIITPNCGFLSGEPIAVPIHRVTRSKLFSPGIECTKAARQKTKMTKLQWRHARQLVNVKN